MTLKIFNKYKQAILFGISMALLLFLLKCLEYKYLVFGHAIELYITSIAIVFTALGGWLAIKTVRPKVETRVETVVIEKEVYRQPDPLLMKPFLSNEIEKANLGLSNRELEVLILMAKGLTNQEIAGQLFLSLNTIKTHSSKLFEKMDVKRRTQAIEKAKRLHIIE